MGGADLGSADPLPRVGGQIRLGSAGRHHGAIPLQDQTQAPCTGKHQTLPPLLSVNCLCVINSMQDFHLLTMTDHSDWLKL